MTLNAKNLTWLQSQISGRLALPDDKEYHTSITIDNGRVERHPGVIVFPLNARDVAIALQFAQDNQLGFTVRGGGHSANGYCLNTGGMVLDMSLLKDIQLNAKQERLKVQIGLTWMEIYQFLHDSGTGLIPVGGACSTVGIGGFIQGGGVSFVSRSYGLASDNVIAFTIVLANGDIRYLHRDEKMSKEDKELFWALQGGGGGNFGVVVDIEVELHRTNTPIILGAELYYSLDRAEEVIGFYNEWIQTVPDTLAVYGYLGPAPEDAGQQIQTIRFQPVFNGDYDEGMKLIQPLLELGPIYSNIYRTSLIEYEMAVGRSTLVANRNAYIRSAMLKKGGLTPKIAKLFKKNMSSPPSQESFAIWMHTGGQIAKKSSTATAYPHRNAEFVFQLKTIWSDPSTELENVGWGYDFVEKLLVDAEGAFVNYIDPLLHNWKQRYYGENIERLLMVKKRVDPTNFFHFQQGVTSDFDPGKLNFKRPECVDLSPLNRTFVTPEVSE